MGTSVSLADITSRARMERRGKKSAADSKDPLHGLYQPFWNTPSLNSDIFFNAVT